MLHCIEARQKNALSLVGLKLAVSEHRFTTEEFGGGMSFRPAHSQFVQCSFRAAKRFPPSEGRCFAYAVF